MHDLHACAPCMRPGDAPCRHLGSRDVGEGRPCGHGVCGGARRFCLYLGEYFQKLSLNIFAAGMILDVERPHPRLLHRYSCAARTRTSGVQVEPPLTRRSGAGAAADGSLDPRTHGMVERIRGWHWAVDDKINSIGSK